MKGGKTLSAKIYTGVKLEANSIYELTKLVKLIRGKLTLLAQEEYAKAIARMVEQAYAYQKYGVLLDGGLKDPSLIKDVQPDKLLWEICKISRQTMKANKSSETYLELVRELDFNVRLTAFALPDGRFLGIPYVENDVLRKALLDTPEVQEYGYWDNVDKPDNVSDEEWEQRETDWTTALTGIGIPLNDGFTYEIVNDDVHILKYVATNTLSKYFTPLEAYKKEIARHILRGKMVEEAGKASQEPITLTKILEITNYIKAHPEEVEEIEKGLDIDLTNIT